jgi:hypothetical protein
MDNIDKNSTNNVNRIKHFKTPMYNHLIKPRVLPPLKTKYNDFKTVCSPCKYTRPGKICNYSFNKYATINNSRNKSQYSLANYPYLNPLFNFEKIFEDAYNYTSDDYNSDNISDELDYQYQQRKWIKNASNNVVKKNKINLMNGDVVNIDKKTLVYVNYNEKTKLYIFKELTSLKVHEYDLNKRNYTIVIPKMLKYDITSKNFKKETVYKDPFEKLSPKLINIAIIEENNELSEGYLSDLENGDGQQNSIKTSSDDMINDYVSNTKIESIYNIDKSITKPKIVIHQADIKKIAGDLVDDIIKNVASDNHKESDIEETKKDNSIEIKKDINKEIEKEIEKDNSTDPKKLDADKNITDDSKWCTIM